DPPPGFSRVWVHAHDVEEVSRMADLVDALEREPRVFSKSREYDLRGRVGTLDRRAGRPQKCEVAGVVRLRPERVNVRLVPDLPHPDRSPPAIRVVAPERSPQAVALNERSGKGSVRPRG